jgi:hypothetical protein
MIRSKFSPSQSSNTREQRLDGYRDVRDGLTYRIKSRLKV